LALLAAIIVGGIYFVPRDVFFAARLKTLHDPSGDPTGDGRFGIWHAAVQLWRENPVWGIGPAHFNYRFGKYRPELIQASPDRAHNDYLNTLTDYGIVGAALVLIAWVLVFACAIWTWRFVRGSPNTLGDHRSNKLALVLGASIGLIAILAHSFVDFNMHIPANAIVAVTLMALLSSYVRFATERFWFTARMGSKALLTLALVCGLIYLGSQAARSARESLWLMRADKSETASDEQIAALQKAFAIEPKNFQTARTIGEDFRLQSWQNGDDYKEKALAAMKWFKRATEANPYDDSSYLRYGMCLDQIDEHDQALPYFDRATRMDPNSYFDNAYMGWHYTRSGDYAAAREWFQRSHLLKPTDNPIADTYLQIAQNQMLEAATNSLALQLRPSTNSFVIPPWK
ncbi:MAG TPA: O-antigen ligase family protein, partial [Verrucomicrobiae bacterium]|nr:O-antigen ligase family protein [Verrucomicrobiae bacterium]